MDKDTIIAIIAILRQRVLVNESYTRIIHNKEQYVLVMDELQINIDILKKLLIDLDIAHRNVNSTQ